MREALDGSSHDSESILRFPNLNLTTPKTNIVMRMLKRTNHGCADVDSICAKMNPS